MPGGGGIGRPDADDGRVGAGGRGPAPAGAAGPAPAATGRGASGRLGTAVRGGPEGPAGADGYDGAEGATLCDGPADDTNGAGRGAPAGNGRPGTALGRAGSPTLGRALTILRDSSGSATTGRTGAAEAAGAAVVTLVVTDAWSEVAGAGVETAGAGVEVAAAGVETAGAGVETAAMGAVVGAAVAAAARPADESAAGVLVDVLAGALADGAGAEVTGAADDEIGASATATAPPGLASVESELDAALAVVDAFFAAPFLASLASSGCADRVRPSRSARRRSRSACASMTAEDWLLASTPIAPHSASNSGFVIPSSLASSCTRRFFAKLVQPFIGVASTDWCPAADHFFVIFRLDSNVFLSSSSAPALTGRRHARSNARLR